MRDKPAATARRLAVADGTAAWRALQVRLTQAVDGCTDAHALGNACVRLTKLTVRTHARAAPEATREFTAPALWASGATPLRIRTPAYADFLFFPVQVSGDANNCLFYSILKTYDMQGKTRRDGPKETSAPDLRLSLLKFVTKSEDNPLFRERFSTLGQTPTTCISEMKKRLGTEAMAETEEVIALTLMLNGLHIFIVSNETAHTPSYTSFFDGRSISPYVPPHARPTHVAHIRNLHNQHFEPLAPLRKPSAPPLVAVVDLTVD